MPKLIHTQEEFLEDLYPNYRYSPLESYIISSITNFEEFTDYNSMVRITRFLKHQALNTFVQQMQFDYFPSGKIFLSRCEQLLPVTHFWDCYPCRMSFFEAIRSVDARIYCRFRNSFHTPNRDPLEGVPNK